MHKVEFRYTGAEEWSDQVGPCDDAAQGLGRLGSLEARGDANLG